MHQPLLLSTGGTFNKIYNPFTGTLDIDPNASALYAIIRKWLSSFKIQTLINKDSLEFTNNDRNKLLEAISTAQEQTVIVIHGTDTMDISAEFVAGAMLAKRIIFTGAMVPYAFDQIEATANLASAIGYAMADDSHGVFIAMNGSFGSYTDIIKDRSLGYFVHRG